MGSRCKNDLAYIAGFLDGDGSLMLQLKKRKDGNRSAHRFMVTVCFYQDARHEKPLHWIRDIIGIGYVSKRNDGIAELRVNGFKQIQKLLESLLPFIKFKKIQAKALLQSSILLQKKKLLDSDLRKLVDNILVIQNENYVTRRKRNKKELLKVLHLTP